MKARFHMVTASETRAETRKVLKELPTGIKHVGMVEQFSCLIQITGEKMI